MKTYQAEAFAVAAILFCVWLSTGSELVELCGSVAVLATFAHAQVSDRMAEREALRSKPDVACYRWSARYFITKELLWLGYFLAHRNWSALVGVGVFLLYPAWRSWYRGYYPLERLS